MNSKNINSSIKSKNKIYFKNYFMQTWCRGNLSPKSYKFIKELNKTDIALKNKKVVKYIYETYEIYTKSVTSNYIQTEDEIYNIINQNRDFYDISLGDVIFLINSIKDKFVDIETQSLVFAIKTMYSFFLDDSLYEWKLEIYQKLKNTLDCKNKKIQNKKIEYDKYPNYLILVGDSFYNTNEYERSNIINKQDIKNISKHININEKIYNLFLNNIGNKNFINFKNNRELYVNALELSFLMFSKKFKIKNGKIGYFYLKQDGFKSNNFCSFSFFTNILNIFYYILLEEMKSTNKNMRFLYDRIKIISKEENTIFSILFSTLYNGLDIEDADNKSKLSEIIRARNINVIKSNIYNIIDEFAFTNIEILENSIFNTKIGSSNRFEKVTYNLLKEIINNKRKLEYSKNEISKTSSIISKVKSFNSFTMKDNLTNMFLGIYRSPYGRTILVDNNSIVLDDMFTGLYATVLEDFKFSQLWDDELKYDIYRKCLDPQFINKSVISCSEFDKMDLNILYERIDKAISKKLY